MKENVESFKPERGQETAGDLCANGRVGQAQYNLFVP